MFNPYQPLRKPKKKKAKRKKQKPAPKKRGRKKIPRRFDEVRLGWTLRLYTPLEYDLIMQAAGPFSSPHPDLIESVSYTSVNPFFRTQEFRKLLMEYRENGCHTSRVRKPPTPKQIKKAARKRLAMAKEMFTPQCES